MDRSPARHRPGREIWPEGARGGDACRIQTDQAIEHIHVLALLICGEFAECVLFPAKEDLAAPRHWRVDWGLVHLQEDFACRRMPAVDGLSASSSAPRSRISGACHSTSPIAPSRVLRHILSLSRSDGSVRPMLGIAGHRRCSRRLIDCRQPRRLRTHCHERTATNHRMRIVGSMSARQMCLNE